MSSSSPSPMNPLTDCSRERITFLNSALVAVIVQVLYSVVFVNAAFHHFPKYLSSRRNAWGTSAFRRNTVAIYSITFFMFAISTASLISRWVIVNEAFNSQNGSTGRYLCDGASSQGLSALNGMAVLLNIVLTNVVLCWRCCTLASSGRMNYKVALNVAALITVVTLLMAFDQPSFNLSRRWTVAPYDVFPSTNSLSSLICLILSLLVALCSTSYIALHKTLALKDDSEATLGNIFRVLVVESGALYPTILLVHIILCFISNRWGSRYTSAILISLTGILSTLVLKEFAGQSRSALIQLPSDEEAEEPLLVPGEDEDGAEEAV